MSAVTWSSHQLPVTDGTVPAPIVAALVGLREGRDRTRHLATVSDYLELTCAELAQSRAQVLADRAELDRLRRLHGLAIVGRRQRETG